MLYPIQEYKVTTIFSTAQFQQSHKRELVMVDP